MPLTPRSDDYVYARHQNTCQRLWPGCAITSTQLQLAYNLERLAAIKRDDDANPDNWFSVCNNCVSGDTFPGELPITLGS